MKRINLYPFKLFSSHSKLNKTSFFPQRNSQYCLVETWFIFDPLFKDHSLVI